MKKGLLSLAGALALALTASPAAATTYYVSPGTQATENGSLATPYQTLNGALAGLTLVAGDEIRVGKGAITVTGTMTIPNGVTVRGGYLGGWGANAWTSSNPAQYATAFTYNGAQVFTLNGGTLDGVYIFKNNSSFYAVGMNTGGVLKNSTIKHTFNAVNGYGNGVTVEGNTIDQGPSCCWNYVVYNSGYMKLQNNVITTRYGIGAYFDGKGVIRGNKFYGDKDYWFYYLVYVSDGGVDIYENLLDGGTREDGTGLYVSWSSSGPVLVENNNITNIYEAFESWSYEEWWGWDYPITVRNNAIWNVGGGTDSEGLYLGGEYPYEWTRFQGNCVMDSSWYLYTYNGTERYGYGTAELDNMLPEIISGNVRMAAPPATPTSSACGGKGMTGVQRKTKPIAHGHAQNTVTGTTYAVNTAVHAGQAVLLNGYDHDWNGSDTESQQFEGGDLTYLWSFHSGPAPVTVYSTGNLGEVKSAKLTTPGTYVFKLQVRNDNPGSDKVISDPFYVTVYVGNKVTVLTSSGSVRGTFNYLQDAIDAAQFGDTVQLPAGVFQPGENADDDEDEGKIYSKNSITIRGAGSGANGTVFHMNCDNEPFDIQYSSNITIRDIRFSDVQDCDYDAIYAYESTLLVDNIVFSGKGQDPWYSGYVVETEYSIATVQNSTFEYLEYPIYMTYGRGKVLNNTFRAVYYYAVDSEYLDNYGFESIEVVGNNFDGKWAPDDYGVYLYDLGYGDGPFAIRNNTFSNFYCCEMIEVYYANYGAPVLIEGNTLYNDKRWYGSSHYTYGIYLYYTNAYVRNNIISGMSYSGVYIDNSSPWGGEEVGLEGNVIAYNGRYSTDYQGIENYGMECPNGNTAGNCRYTAWARNNVLYGNTGGSYYQVNVLDGNVYEDPKFVNADTGNFTPAAGSPLRDMPGTGLPTALVLPAPTGLTGEPLPGAARISFDEVPGATGYVLLWGETAGDYAQSRDLAKERVATVDKLAAMPYYFAVRTKNGGQSSAIVVVPEAVAEEVTTQSSPAVFGVEPTLITAGAATELTITGSAFAEGAKVMLGTLELADAVVVDEYTVKVTATDVKAGIYPVVVVNADLGRGALPMALTVRSKGGSADDAGCASAQGDAGLLLMLLPLAMLWLRRRSA